MVEYVLAKDEIGVRFPVLATVNYRNAIFNGSGARMRWGFDSPYPHLTFIAKYATIARRNMGSTFYFLVGELNKKGGLK